MFKAGEQTSEILLRNYTFCIPWFMSSASFIYAGSWYRGNASQNKLTSSQHYSKTLFARQLSQNQHPCENLSLKRRGDLQNVCCSYEEAYKKIRENRIARKLAKEQVRPKQRCML
jgi:hypothetical protein